ncbi:MAG: CRISPR-associated helicase/endonuclease Cas3 [Planctomycetaceae bacterium]|nr:MAG: CRISPR-associated helicase/endonuclease Cas3 [Planctomycetaceae bacterium]
MASLVTFNDWFQQLTQHSRPYPWQQTLAQDATCRSRLIRIPTGLGKTEGVLSAWMYHRLARQDPDWPRRLVWCLPQRVLVEQTAAVAQRMVQRMKGLLPAGCELPQIHLVMGGEDAGEWYLYPERAAILIGTQDMLLSRALNRGYGMPRARWPMEFGLLHHDCLWVIDEVQLMDVGLTTSAHLQAFRQQLPSLRPCHTWWMSATLQPEWLQTIDTESQYAEWNQHRCEVPSGDRASGVYGISKRVETCEINAAKQSAFVQLILEKHQQLKDEGHGRITLVVCNTVERACETYDMLEKECAKKSRASTETLELQLAHSRFRPYERQSWPQQWLSREACQRGAHRIIVATQVIEAGVDISAGCLITECAPWPSLVQRFGRCARYGGSGIVVIVNRGLENKYARPYNLEDLQAVWDVVTSGLHDASLQGLEAFEQQLKSKVRNLYRYEPYHLLLLSEFVELFDTTPDLTGADLDISRYIRSDAENDVVVCWIDVKEEEDPPAKFKPQRRELCAIPVYEARKWLLDKKSKKLREKMRAWVWDWLEGQWQVVKNERELYPGRIVCVSASCGGYTPARGFDPESKEPVVAVPSEIIPEDVSLTEQADDEQDSESQSAGQWKTLARHAAEVVDELQQLLSALGLSETYRQSLELAGWLHDWGKAHPAFQGSIRAELSPRPDRHDVAKAPPQAWRLRAGYTVRDPTHPPRIVETRRGFRHELASVLALFAVLRDYHPLHPSLRGDWEDDRAQVSPAADASRTAPAELLRRVLQWPSLDLVAYLIASHHGKVRMGMHASPHDQEYQDHDGRGLPIRGVREGDELPAVVLQPDDQPFPVVTLSLSLATLGVSPHTGASWQERCVRLLKTEGPLVLGWLEALLRVADVRASRRVTTDPVFSQAVASRMAPVTDPRQVENSSPA